MRTPVIFGGMIWSLAAFCHVAQAASCGGPDKAGQINVLWSQPTNFVSGGMRIYPGEKIAVRIDPAGQQVNIGQQTAWRRSATDWKSCWNGCPHEPYQVPNFTGIGPNAKIAVSLHADRATTGPSVIKAQPPVIETDKQQALIEVQQISGTPTLESISVPYQPKALVEVLDPRFRTKCGLGPCSSDDAFAVCVSPDSTERLEQLSNLLEHIGVTYAQFMDANVYNDNVRNFIRLLPKNDPRIARVVRALSVQVETYHTTQVGKDKSLPHGKDALELLQLALEIGGARREITDSLIRYYLGSGDMQGLKDVALKRYRETERQVFCDAERVAANECLDSDWDGAVRFFIEDSITIGAAILRNRQLVKQGDLLEAIAFFSNGLSAHKTFLEKAQLKKNESEHRKLFTYLSLLASQTHFTAGALEDLKSAVAKAEAAILLYPGEITPAIRKINTSRRVALIDVVPPSTLIGGGPALKMRSTEEAQANSDPADKMGDSDQKKGAADLGATPATGGMYRIVEYAGTGAWTMPREVLSFDARDLSGKSGECQVQQAEFLSIAHQTGGALVSCADRRVVAVYSDGSDQGDRTLRTREIGTLEDQAEMDKLKSGRDVGVPAGNVGTEMRLLPTEGDIVVRVIQDQDGYILLAKAIRIVSSAADRRDVVEESLELPKSRAGVTVGKWRLSAAGRATDNVRTQAKWAMFRLVQESTEQQELEVAVRTKNGWSTTILDWPKSNEVYWDTLNASRMDSANDGGEPIVLVYRTKANGWHMRSAKASKRLAEIDDDATVKLIGQYVVALRELPADETGKRKASLQIFATKDSDLVQIPCKSCAAGYLVSRPSLLQGEIPVALEQLRTHTLIALGSSQGVIVASDGGEEVVTTGPTGVPYAIVQERDQVDGVVVGALSNTESATWAFRLKK